MKRPHFAAVLALVLVGGPALAVPAVARHPLRDLRPHHGVNGGATRWLRW